MSESLGNLVRWFRLRHGLSQQRMAALVRVPQRTISCWESGIERPEGPQLGRLRDLVSSPPHELIRGLSASVVNCPLPRALSRGPKLQLQVLSAPALAKRPSMIDWIGHDLGPIAAGVLQEMLDDSELQQAMSNKEVAGVIATTQSVLQTAESEQIATYRTRITYFFHDRTIYSDAISLPVSADERLGYTPIAMDELGTDLFGDRSEIEAALLEAGSHRAVGRRRAPAMIASSQG